MGSYINLDDATYMTDIYFSNTDTLVIKDITGDKHIVNLDTLAITYMHGEPFPEIYIKPYWYS